MSKEAPQPHPSPDSTPTPGNDTSSAETQQGLQPSEPAYHVVTSETPLGGAIYPFLERTGRAWSQVARPIAQEIPYPNAASFGMETPTLRWVNGPNVIDVFVERLTTKQFLIDSGLVLTMEKGGYILSKRLSRLMRPYFVSRSFPANEISVRYLNDLDHHGKKVWDGAGVISRTLLNRLAIPPGVGPAKRSALERQLQRGQRVEFTLLTHEGQDKGHAIVADHLPVDFVLPRDTKREVKLINGMAFVGINFVEAHREMRLDIQSLINLYPFFREEQLAQWLDEEGALFVQTVQSGVVSEVMGRLEHDVTLADLAQWPLREYFASGGHPLWFADVAKNVLNQHLARLNKSTLEKFHLPIPGGRFYVMPIGVGQAAGVVFDVPRGHIRLDRRYGTAWVNDEDWVELEGASTGIAGLLGGADNDDALWVHGFTDYDGELKVLCWRSPNQVGEYVILQPTIGSYNLDWETPDGVVQYPPGDSRLLPPRKDTVYHASQQLIDPATAGGLGEGKAYSIDGMAATIQRAKANAGALGMYCNMLMVGKAVDGGLPAQLPAELEEVIDGSVKTGVDLSPVRWWCYEESRRILDSGTPIPAILASRIVGASDQRPVTLTEGHWLDRLVGMVKGHITAFERQRDELVQAAMPPAVIFDHVFNDSDLPFIEVGTGLHHAYHNRLRLLFRQKNQLSPEDYETAREEAEHYLARFPEEQHTAILRGAIVSAYLWEEPSDTVLWLPGPKTGQGRVPGIAHKTIAALREIGVLQEVGETKLGLLIYPGASVSEPVYQKSIGITGVWFNWLKRWQETQGQEPAATMQDVSKAQAQWAKAQVANLAQSSYRDLPLTIQVQGERKVALLPDGTVFGFIRKDSTEFVPEGAIMIALSICHDGNLRSLWHPAD